MDTQNIDFQEGVMQDYLRGRKPKKTYVLSTDEEGNPDSTVKKYAGVRTAAPLSPMMTALMAGRR